MYHPYYASIGQRILRHPTAPLQHGPLSTTPEELQASLDRAVDLRLSPAIIASLREQLRQALARRGITQAAPGAPTTPPLVADVARLIASLALQQAPTETSAPIGYLPQGSVVRVLSNIQRTPYPRTPAAAYGWALVQTLTADGAGATGFVPIHLLAGVPDLRYVLPTR